MEPRKVSGRRQLGEDQADQASLRRPAQPGQDQARPTGQPAAEQEARHGQPGEREQPDGQQGVGHFEDGSITVPAGDGFPGR